MLNPIPSGSKIGIVAPSCALSSPEDIREGLRWLESSGYRIVLGQYVFEKNNHLAGTAEQRAEDIMHFFADPEIKALIAVCGGYGAQEVLPLLKYDVIAQNPKPIIGFSDTTALQTAVFTKTGNINYAGILLKYDFKNNSRIHPYTADSFLELMNGNFKGISGGIRINGDCGEGKLIGTNLCVLELLAGTNYFPDLNDSILLLEDVDEKSYRIERMLTQLSQHPTFKGVKGIIFGQFNEIYLNHPEDKDINQIIYDFAQKHPIPIIKDFPFGHVRARKSVPLGAQVILDADKCFLKLKI